MQQLRPIPGVTSCTHMFAFCSKWDKPQKEEPHGTDLHNWVSQNATDVYIRSALQIFIKMIIINYLSILYN